MECYTHILFLFYSDIISPDKLLLTTINGKINGITGKLDCNYFGAREDILYMYKEGVFLWTVHG